MLVLHVSEKGKKRSRRNERYPGLHPELHPRTRWEMFDQDYLDKLTPEEKLWLSNFNEEYVGGNFNHKEGDVLHTTQELKRDCYSRNNARNRDYYAINRSSIMDVELREVFANRAEAEEALEPEESQDGFEDTEFVHSRDTTPGVDE